jgi:DNA-directed RNA polymerase I subunit RPA2
VFLISFFLFRFMLQKLYALVDQTASPDNPDALQYQEALLPGHLFTVFLKVAELPGAFHVF